MSADEIQLFGLRVYNKSLFTRVEGLQMDFMILGLLVLSLIAAFLARMVRERHLDRQSADSALDRFHRLEVSKQHQPVSLHAY
jgi:hypothetical protein